MARKDGLCWHWQFAAFCLALALVFSRQPDAILHAQFYGEDGHVWFAEAYNRGWLTSLLRTQDGYFQTLPRLAAALSLALPLNWSPLVMNLVGLVTQLLPVPVLLSHRLRRMGSVPFRSVLALVYVALPNCRELNVTVTEAGWHLAFLASLLVLAEAPRSKAGRAFDLVIWVLCVLTGPFCLILLPIALIYWRMRKQTGTWISIAVLACGSTVQGYALLFSDSARQHTFALGATPEGFVRILAGQVYLGALLGSNMLGASSPTLLLFGVAVLGTAIVVYIGVRTGAEFRFFH